MKSYFSTDLIETRGPRIVDMVTKSKSLKFQETDSVLEAVILETNLIKKYQPYYNILDRDDRSSQYVIITDEMWPRVFLARARDFDQLVKDGKLDYAVKRKFGPYPEIGLIKEALKILRKMFPFKDKKSHDPRHDAFYKAIGRSPYGDDSAAHSAYEKTIEHMIMFFDGKKSKLRREVESEMKRAAEEMRFETAGQAKRLLYALEHINDMSLVKAENVRQAGTMRIEAYDIAHLSGMETVGAMVVSVNGQPATDEYRKFKISKDQNNDAANVHELLSRRLNHPEWQYPDIIVVDGNEIQMSVAEDVLKARRISIPVIAVTKDDKHRAFKLIGLPDLIKLHKKSIIAANAEAHRYVLAYHRLRRSKRLRNAS